MLHQSQTDTTPARFRTRLANARKAAKGFTQSPAWRRQAHNPACAGSVVQIHPHPATNFFDCVMQSTPDRYYVYVLRNPAGTHYIGLTDDLARRLTQHNSGASKWTKAKGPWKLCSNLSPLAVGKLMG